uniref:DUF2428 domain-containing protein n=1 Tax=Arion vulgaris TaxID=1028688 RepID=A0A0B6ZRY9_9EUPU
MIYLAQTIFCDASLATKLLPLLSKMTVLVVKGFDSPSWSIRNAATQLITADNCLEIQFSTSYQVP